MIRRALILLAVFSALPAAAEAPPPLPAFASFARAEVYLRQGPTYGHKVLWIYHRKGLPAEVLARYDVWRRVRLPDGAVGWVHASQLSPARTVQIAGKARVTLRKAAEPGAKAAALAEPGVIAKLRECQPAACRIQAGGAEGWADKNKLWGVRAGEVF